jgi:DNA polymerase III delta subunit
MVITLTGDNNFALQQELTRLVSAYSLENGDLSIEHYDGEEDDFALLSSAFTSLSLFSDKRMVIIRQASKNKQFAEQFEELIKDVSSDLSVILIEPKLDKRLSYYKNAKKHTEFKDFKQLDQSGLVNWLISRAKQRGGNISSDDARFLIERVGYDQQNLKNEIDKLLLYDPKVTGAKIELLTEPIPQSTIFNLIESAFNSRLKKTFDIYWEQRDLHVEPQQIIAMMTWQLHILAIIKTNSPDNLDDIIVRAKLNPYVVRKSQPIAKKIGLDKLVGLVKDLVDVDVRLKSQSVDADEILQNYLLSMSI